MIKSIIIVFFLLFCSLKAWIEIMEIIPCLMGCPFRNHSTLRVGSDTGIILASKWAFCPSLTSTDLGEEVKTGAWLVLSSTLSVLYSVHIYSRCSFYIYKLLCCKSKSVFCWLLDPVVKKYVGVIIMENKKYESF